MKIKYCRLIVQYRNIKKEAIWCISSSKYVNEMFIDLIERGVDANNIVVPQYGLAIASRGNQYFDMFPPEDEEVFIDCGAFKGDTIDAFQGWTNGKFKKIYSLEPSKRNFNQLASKYKSDARIILINAAVWNKAGKISVNEHEAGTTVGSKGNEFIDSIDIDSLGIKEKVSYIKMDIEGSEMHAIIGGKETIQRCRPKLAICVYHKPEDIIDIPSQILKWRDDYKLSLRHYCSYWWETVLYAF